MPHHSGPKRGATLLALSGEQTIRTAGALRAQLLGALDTPVPFTITLSDVTACDVAAVQTLAAAARTAAAAGGAIRLESAPDTPFADLAAAIGLPGTPAPNGVLAWDLAGDAP